MIESLKLARGGDLSLLKARLVAAGLDEALIERLQTAQLVELPGYTTNPGGESARDRATRREAVEQAVEADLMILVIDGRRDTHAADVALPRPGISGTWSTPDSRSPRHGGRHHGG